MMILKKNGTSVDTYMNHAKQHNWWNQNTKGKTNKQIMWELQNKPVCPKCETLAMRHGSKDTAKCPKCGWFGKVVTLDEIITHQLYK